MTAVVGVIGFTTRDGVNLFSDPRYGNGWFQTTDELVPGIGLIGSVTAVMGLIFFKELWVSY